VGEVCPVAAAAAQGLAGGGVGRGAGGEGSWKLPGSTGEGSWKLRKERHHEQGLRWEALRGAGPQGLLASRVTDTGAAARVVSLYRGGAQRRS